MLSGNVPILKETKNWYLPLNEYEDFLNEWIIEGHKDDWKPNVYGQVKSWLNDGLKPRAMTRDLNWGVPVPLPNAEGKVLYVWFDAPIGYISFTKEWARKTEKTGKITGKAKKVIWFTLSEKIILYSTVLFSLR
jgi:methionyl-tRNA synthetase